MGVAMPVETPREKAIRKLQAARSGFTSPRPDITVAFDAGVAALVKHGASRDEALAITRAVLRAVMDADFMIMHRDEMHDAMLAIGHAGKILNEADREETALARTADNGGGDA